ncbi:mediator of RNA polymerase II transcription subunit 9-like isoform X1 [Miscanthus floridulus]|uniref:mediator of RNA polymerase II transcription subunit 9-like isoform X1 n=1 Tax=Miscanthus floridulus TaxID=154761 RepID=UPI003457AF5C
MDHHHPQQQQYGDPYRGLVPSPQPDHHLHALQYHQPQPQQQPALMSPPQPQPALMSPQPQQALMSPPQPQQHHHASLASHFHLLHLVTRLADAIGTGTRDQNSDALVEELTSQFARCQQLLNSISGTISSKSTTVEGQRQSLDETRQLLDQRKELITKYRSSVEDLLKGDKR